MKRSEIEVLQELVSGGSVSSTKLKDPLRQRLVDEHLISSISHGSRITYRALSPEAVASEFSAELASAASDAIQTSRAAQVALFGDSKIVPARSCPGFPVNSCEPILAVLNGHSTVISPENGTFVFICDWQKFRIPPDVVVVGVENMENFRKVRRMMNLFDRYSAPILFVSRYPQSGDLVSWLQTIPNRYVHFGDLDLAGIHIFLHEFHRFLGGRSEFYIPSDADLRLSTGSRRRYDDQLPHFGKMAITDPRVQYLVDLIHKHHRGYDQEGYLLPFVR